MTMAALGLTLRRDFFSPVQRDQFVIDVFAPQGSAVTYTNELVEGIDDLWPEYEDHTNDEYFYNDDEEELYI